MRQLSVAICPVALWSVVFTILLLAPFSSSSIASAQAISLGRTVNIVAGTGTPGYSGDGGLAIDAELLSENGLATDQAGNFYFPDNANSLIRKVTVSTGIINTVAGTGVRGYSGDGGPATKAEMYQITNIAVSKSGDLYIADGGSLIGNNNIRKVDATTGIISTAAHVMFPDALAIDAAGNLYMLTGEFAATVSELSVKTGLISVVAGNGTQGYSGDGGQATSAELNYPQSIAVDNLGNLYVADSGNNRIRKVDVSTGIITTVAGDGVAGYSGDGGPATGAELNRPDIISFDGAGNLYISDHGNNLIRKVDAVTGIITTIAGNTGLGYSGIGGTARAAELDNVVGMAADPSGNVFLSEVFTGLSEYVLEVSTKSDITFFPTSVGARDPIIVPLDINTSGTVITGISAPVSQGGKQEFVIGTPSCALNTALPAGTECDVPVTFSPAYPGERIAPLIVTTTAGTFRFGMKGLGTGPEVALTPATIRTVAGNGTNGFSGNGGPALAAALNNPGSMAFDTGGNLYISDTGNNQVREISSANGMITNVAGSATAGSPALNAPGGLVLDAAGNLYIADAGNNVVRKVSALTGAVATIAGTGASGDSGDGGPATGAQLSHPSDLALDSFGNLYIADCGNNVVRKVSTTGIISTFAGNGNQGYSGDGSAAASAKLNAPCSLAFDNNGNLYIGDSGNNAVRKITGTGTISTFAGNGTAGYSGDGGIATSAELNDPEAVRTDSAGDVYFADAGNNVVRMVNGIDVITTVAGTGAPGDSGDGGSATHAQIAPSGLALDNAGNIYIANASGSAIREVNVLDGILNFAATPIDATSADSPQTATITDIGNGLLNGNGKQNNNEELQFWVPASGLNPSITNSDFTLTNGGTCPQLDPTSSTTTAGRFNPGDSCTVTVSFTPSSSGTINGTVNIADNSLNAISTFPAVQMIHLTGVGTGTGPGGGGGGNPLANFTISATPASQTIAAGTTATYTISVTGTNGFTGAVSLTAAGLPSGATANFNPPSVTISGATPMTAALTITTAKNQAQSSSSPPLSGKGAPLLLGAFFLPLLGLAGARKRMRSMRHMAFTIVFLMLALGAICSTLTSCANIGLQDDPQSYTITIQGTSGPLQQSTTVTLNVNQYTTIKYK